MTRANSKDHIGDDVAMEEDSSDESSAGHPSLWRPDSRRRITNEEDEQPGTTEQQEALENDARVAVTTQEALDGYREKR